MRFSMRRTCLTASILASALMVCAALAGAAQANVSVGNVLIEQKDADGQIVSTQEYLVSNSYRQMEVPVSEGAVVATIFNGTSRSLSVSALDGTTPVTIASNTERNYVLEGKANLFLDFLP